MQDSPMIVQYKELGDSSDFLVIGEELRVPVIRPVVHRNCYEMRVPQCREVRVLIEKLIHLAAIHTPVSPHIEKNALSGALRLNNCFPQIGSGVTFGVEPMVRYGLCGGPCGEKKYKNSECLHKN